MRLSSSLTKRNLICEDNNIMTTSNILFSSAIYSSSLLENKYTTNKKIETTEFFKTSIPENKESITSTFVDIIEESINNINTTNIEEITTFESSLITKPEQLISTIQQKESTYNSEQEKTTSNIEQVESSSKSITETMEQSSFSPPSIITPVELQPITGTSGI